ncbi:MAG: PilZ domain-containing protein [Erythrobacter sp.]|uniref:PilZ domain-containing protein n=1 Tax=Erythrobacter sp. TaxID=1042 RepID=UPI0032EBA2FC
MTGVDTRSVARDSLFLLADLKLEESDETHRVRVRNLSDGGMMGEASLQVRRGNRVRVALRNIGEVQGSVAWVQDDRFGVAFDSEIDSQRARRPAEGDDAGSGESFTSYAHRAPRRPDPKTLRKV